MKDLLIRLLFRLLGHSYTPQYNIPHLFGASTAGHAARKRNWERALVRIAKDPALLDFLFYQAESDKENVWRGKIDRRLSQGARLRTLFIVYSARRAHAKMVQQKRSTGQEAGDIDEQMKDLSKTYRSTVDIGALQEDEAV